MAEMAGARRAPLHRRRQRRAGRPAHAPGHGVRRRPRRHAWPSTARSTRWPRAATCTRGSGRPGSASPASRPRPRSSWSSATSPWPGSPAPASTSSTCRPPARSSWCAPAKAGGLPVTAEATPHHFTLTHAEVADLRPGVQGQPAAAHRRRRGRHQGRAGRRHHRRHRHRPRAAHPGGQGAPVRPGAAGHAGPRDGAGAGPRPSSTCPIERRRSALHVVAAGRHRRPRRRRTAARSPQVGLPTCASSIPTTTWTVDPAGVASRSRNTPYAGRTLSGRVRHTLGRRRARRHRRRGPDDEPESITEAAARAGRRHHLRGRGHRRRAAGGVATGEVVFNTVLTGTRRSHRSLLRRADHHLHLPPHRQLRGRRPLDDESAGRSAAASSSATWPAAAATGAATATSTPSSAATASPGIAGIDTRRLTRHLRDAGAMPGAFGTADEVTLKQAAAGRAGHRRRRPRRRGDLRRALHRRLTVRAGSSPTTSASSGRSWPQLGADRDGRGRARVDTGGRGAGPPARRRVPVQRSRRSRRRRLRHRSHQRAAGRGARLRDLPGPPAARRGTRRRDLQAALRPPRRQPPGAPPRDGRGRDHRARTTTTRSSTRRRRPSRSPTATSTTAPSRASAIRHLHLTQLVVCSFWPASGSNCSRTFFQGCAGSRCSPTPIIRASNRNGAPPSRPPRHWTSSRSTFRFSARASLTRALAAVADATRGCDAGLPEPVTMINRSKGRAIRREPTAAIDVRMERILRSRRAVELRRQPARDLFPARQIRRQDLARRKSGRAARRAARKIRTRRQSQDGQACLARSSIFPPSCSGPARCSNDLGTARGWPVAVPPDRICGRCGCAARCSSNTS